MNDLDLTVTTSGDTMTVQLAGAVTEFSSFSPVLDAKPGANGAPKKVVIDLGGVDHINSSGVREWINFLRTLEKMGAEVELWRCSVPVVRQMTMIPSARVGARLRSVLLPYYCASCDDDRVLLVDIPSARGIEDEAPCPVCSGTMKFDDHVAAYLPLLKG